jgi:serine/threonine-protein kinase
VRTKTGLVKGKVAYMSPEQARGHKVDRRCDVWAAGVVVWELVTGRKLYDHEDDVATLLSVVTEEPPRLAQVLQGVPASLDEAVAYALTSDVSRRCPSAETLRCMLESAWDECGGMATPAELGAFVRQTVGHKLTERRALAMRGRTGAADAAPASSSAPITPGTASDIAAPREDGTKTAISAAVPAAEQRSQPSPIPRWRKPGGLAVGGAFAVAVAALAVAIIQPSEVPRGTAVTRPARPSAPAPPAVAPAAAPATSAPAVVMQPPSEEERRNNGPARATGERSEADAVSEAVSEALSEPSEKRDGATEPATYSGSSRAARRAQRNKASSTRTRARSGTRQPATRGEKAAPSSTPWRLPLPEPSERQRRRNLPSATQPAPLPIAPDPYDSEK